MGSRVGPYIVTSTLGQGTFGKVKLAQHQETGIEYAIKILDKSDIKANELTVNVRREIAIMKALNHNNIVNLREVLSSKSKYVARSSAPRASLRPAPRPSATSERAGGCVGACRTRERAPPRTRA